jgi:ankyrin repeat protein
MDDFSKDYGWIKRDSGLTDNLKVVEKLIETGEEINEWGIVGETSIQTQASNGNFEIVKYLLKKKADPYIKNLYNSDDAITSAIHWGHKDIANFLIKNCNKKDCIKIEQDNKKN